MLMEDLLTLFTSIGVILPTHTKIPDEDLTKKLTAALDAAQELSLSISLRTNVICGLQVGPQPGSPCVPQHLLKENGPPNFISTDKKDTFQELRQIPLSFANHRKGGHRHFCLLDDARQYGVYIRASAPLSSRNKGIIQIILNSKLVKVHKLSDKPLFILLYKELFSTPSKPFVDLFPILVNKLTGQFGMMSITTTDTERIAMVKLFKQNAKRLPAGYSPRAFTRAEARRTGLKVSFALPLVPPDMCVLGKLSDNAGCEVCGNKKITRCSECMTVAYGGLACQKADWKAHKRTCESLSGGTWSNVHIDDQPPYFVTYEHAEMLKRR
ncbi:hypothetical protein D9619_006815 [Psilocybe cf. subviscida]|uniref:MYND-type domain-containing protein n=1 Tax=Psilocybe cf. subviscida TaxID=2480587 RepID=A0A8H5B594_9AGAR|nr:hypothetical protein D9619_006815 [Psilocybe cf. subviscida]